MKAGATVNSDYFRGLAAFEKAFPTAIASGSEVYGGGDTQTRSRWSVRSWRAV